YHKRADSFERRCGSLPFFNTFRPFPSCRLAGKFLGRLLVFALTILPGGQLRAKAREVLQCVVPKGRAQAEKGYRGQKAWPFGRRSEERRVGKECRCGVGGG